MKTTNTPAQRHVMIWAFFGLITTLLVLVWLFNGHLANAQSDDTRQPAIAEAQTGTGFTYQGELILSGPPAEPANGTYRFSFGLFDSETGVAQIGNISAKDILVTNGLFTTLLNKDGEFGPSAFTGDARYLEIKVSTDGGSNYTTLTPRQPLTATPYALGLRPGATISGTRPGNHILTLSNDAPLGDGLKINAAGRGIEVFSNGTALWVNGSSTPIWVDTGGIGYTARAVTEAGFHVSTAGAPSSINESDAKNGFEVSGSEGNGLYVGQADEAGVLVESATTGVHILAAAGNGVAVNSAETGVNVASATNGVYVANAISHGLVVGSAGNGVYVQSATNGVNVESAATGLVVQSATNNGLYVGPADTGVYVAGPVTNYAGYFNGNVTVVGTVSKSAGSFQIDHPLDPENQYLYHSFVESPDMKNIYDGVVVLDENGMALIQMEAWFDVLNQEFRYQLTPIGAAMPGLYIAQEMADNGFRIAGGEAGMKVSWQVTGIRHDPYAEANRIQVEVEKNAEERGTYLYPELYGQPAEMGLAYQKNLALDEQ